MRQGERLPVGGVRVAVGDTLGVARGTPADEAFDGCRVEEARPVRVGEPSDGEADPPAGEERPIVGRRVAGRGLALRAELDPREPEGPDPGDEASALSRIEGPRPRVLVPGGGQASVRYPEQQRVDFEGP
jgi:hypothetical protein